jgi:hypothetical protein
MPALVFRAIVDAKVSLSLLILPGIGIVVVLICMAVAYLTGRFTHFKRPTTGALILLASIGNTGFLGYPLAIQLFGMHNFVRTVFYDLFATVVVMFTIGLLVAERFGEGKDRINIVKEFLTFPPLVALYAALILRFVTLPTFVTDTIGFMAGAAIPLIMFSIGLSLEFAGIGKYKLGIGIVGFIKLVLSPLAALLIVMLVGVHGVDRGVIMLESSMPPFLFSMVIGLKYDLDTDFIPAAIVVCTIISLVTIPIWQYILRVFAA